MPKGLSRNRAKNQGRREKRKPSHFKGEAKSRVRPEPKPQFGMAKGEEALPLEQAQVLLVRTSGQAIKTMEQQTDLMRGETSLIEQQGRKTMVEAIDQAQKLVDQAHQVSTCGIRTSANMAQDWLALTWHMWDTAADAMRSVMLSGTAAAAHRGEA